MLPTSQCSASTAPIALPIRGTEVPRTLVWLGFRAVCLRGRESSDGDCFEYFVIGSKSTRAALDNADWGAV